MRLLQALEQLLNADDSCAVFAKRPWNAESETVIAELTDGVGIPAELRLAGYEYFLEASVAREVVDERAREMMTREQILLMLLYYGEYDGFPDWVNSLLAH